jgi:hypothetical protein
MELPQIQRVLGVGDKSLSHAVVPGREKAARSYVMSARQLYQLAAGFSYSCQPAIYIYGVYFGLPSASQQMSRGGRVNALLSG